MQEIAPNVYIENNSLGLVTGVIRTEEGSVLVDSPVRTDDQTSWRSGTARLVMGEPRFLISLDTNYDRLLSCKGTDCIIIAHSNSYMQPKSRFMGIKNPDEQQSAGESHDTFTNASRWCPSEISFQENMALYVGGEEIQLEYRPGSNHAGIWAILPKPKVIFVGDAVLVDQPPFLAYADLSAWIDDLKILLSKNYRGYTIVSARSGLVDREQVKNMERLINSISNMLSPLIAENAPLEQIYQVIPKILKRFEVTEATTDLYYNRLRWGLATYYEQNLKN